MEMKPSDFIDAEDAGRYNVLALESDISDEFYNVGTGVQTSIKQLCDTILELKNSDLVVITIHTVKMMPGRWSRTNR